MYSVNYYVYILTNTYNKVLYTGFTNDLARRMFEHKAKIYKGFSARYNCNKLLFFEEFIEMDDALHREKQIKKYRRQWKESMISEMNPQWKDLSEHWYYETS